MPESSTDIRIVEWSLKPSLSASSDDPLFEQSVSKRLRLLEVSVSSLEPDIDGNSDSGGQRDSWCLMVTVTVPPLLYLTAFDRRHRIFSANQCLSVMIFRHIVAGRGLTMISREDFKCLQVRVRVLEQLEERLHAGSRGVKRIVIIHIDK